MNVSKERWDCRQALKGSRTEFNLIQAFSGESAEQNKYTYFAARARNEGFEEVATFFEEAANTKREHGKIWFKFLNGGIPATLDILNQSTSKEAKKLSKAYSDMAVEAKAEGFGKIAYVFEEISKIELEYEERLEKLIEIANMC